MRQNNRLTHPTVDAHRARRFVDQGDSIIAATWLVLFYTSTVCAHSMAVTRGTAVVEADSVTLTLEVTGEDLLHDQTLRCGADGLFSVAEVNRVAGDYGKSQFSRIVIRDDNGQHLHGVLKPWVLEKAVEDRATLKQIRHLKIRLEYTYANTGVNRHLSFQQDVSQARPGRSSVIALQVLRENARPQSIRLTRGGNVEVVRLSESREVDDLCSAKSYSLTDAHASVRAVVRIQESGVRVELFMPLRLWETWQPIDRQDRDFLDVAEQIAAGGSIKNALASHNELIIDGRQVKGQVVDIGFLDVGETGTADSRRDRRLSTWTTRLHAVWDYGSPENPRHVDLHWTLFNTAVLSAHAIVAVDNACIERDFSTYDPHLVWTRDAALSERIPKP